MPSALPTSSSCCTSCDDDPIVVSTPGPQGPTGPAGTNGVDGVSATTVTTAQFTVPVSGSNVTIAVDDATFVPQIANSAVVYLSVGNAGYFEIVSKTGNSVTIKNSSAVSASNAAPATVIASGAVVSLAGPQGAAGAAGAGGAPDTATYILQTANGSLGSAQVLSLLSTGFVKVTSGSGVLSSTPTVPVGSVSGSWPLGTVTGTLAIANGGTAATTAAGARTSLGAAASGANSDITSITGLTTALGVAYGGKGTTKAAFVRAYASGAQSIGGTASAVILFGTEDFDADAAFDVGTGRYVPGIASGKVRISATVLGAFAISGTDRYKLSIRRNGTVLTTKFLSFPTGTVDQSGAIDGIFSFSSNTDYFDVHLENLNAAAYNTASTAQGTSFYAEIVGP